MRTLAASVFTLLFGFGSNAHAECTAKTEFEKTEFSFESQSGYVHIQAPSGIRCDANTALLRQVVETGEIVRITQCDEKGRWMDGCFPEGPLFYRLENDVSCECGPRHAWSKVIAVSAGESGCAVPHEKLESNGSPWKDELVCIPPGEVALVAPLVAGCSVGGESAPSTYVALGLVILAVSRRRRA